MENAEKFILQKAAEKTIEKAPENETAEGEEKLPPNVKVVETEKGKFRIAYGMHSIEQGPEDLGEVDALMLEIEIRTSSKKLVEENFNKNCRKFIQYRKIIERAEEKKVPIFLGDVSEEEMVALVEEKTIPIPELIRIRNYLFAQKLKCIAKSLETQKRKPEIAIVIGALHYGIEGALLKEDKKNN